MGGCHSVNPYMWDSLLTLGDRVTFQKIVCLCMQKIIEEI